MKISFCGAGKLGFTCALGVESKGHDVKVYDINPKVGDILKTKNLPYVEAGAQELLNKSKIEFGSLEEIVRHGEIIFVPIQTPHDPKYEGITRLPKERVDFDYSYLKAGVKALADEIQRQGKKKVVVIISTVLPGTIKREILPLLNKYVLLAYNPFFIAMTTTLSDFLNPEFVLFGVHDKEAAEKAKAFYRTIHNRPFFETTIEQAEAIKVFYNTAISTKIVLANTIMEISHKMGLDCDNIIDALSLATDRLISTRYLRGGMGDSGACVPPGTQIQTDKGLKPVEEIAIGDKVLSHDGKYHNVYHLYKRHYKGKLVKITPSGFASFPIIATPEHPIWAAKGKFRGKRLIPTINRYDDYNRKPVRLGYMIGHSEFGKIPICELEQGDVLARSYVTESVITAPTIRVGQVYGPQQVMQLNEEMMFALGVFLAEGNVNVWRGKSEITLAFHIKEKTLALQVASIFEKYWGIKFTIRKRNHSENGFNLRGSSRFMGEFLLNTFGHLAWGKRIPYEWLNLPEGHLRALIRGLWYGDGSNSENSRTFYTTTSRDLFVFVQHALLRFQIPFVTKVTPVRIGKSDGQIHRQSYDIRVTDQKVNELLPNKSVSGTTSRKSIWFENGQMLYKVKAVEQVDYDGYVYNFAVEDTHTYTLEGGVVFNCHPRDNIALSYIARKHDLSFDMFEAMMLAREKQTDWLAAIIEQEAKMKGSSYPIVILGTAYKPHCNLTIGSCAILLKNLLEERGFKNIITYDPYVDGESSVLPNKPSIFFIGAKHNDFKDFKFPTGSVIIDPWRYIPNHRRGVKLIQIGKPQEQEQEIKVKARK